MKRKRVVSAMGNDLTYAADRLLARNPREAAKQGVAPISLYNIGEFWENINVDLHNNGQKTVKSDRKRAQSSAFCGYADRF